MGIVYVFRNLISSPAPEYTLILILIKHNNKYIIILRIFALVIFINCNCHVLHVYAIKIKCIIHVLYYSQSTDEYFNDPGEPRMHKRIEIV